MSSEYRTDLIRGLEGLRAASLESAVRAPDPAGQILRRGLAVSAYNMLETFVEGRLGELTEFINLGQVHYGDLPDRLQQSATRRALEVASARVRRMPETDVRDFVERVGRSLAAVNGPINLSVLTWLWPGSNMGAADFAEVLRAFHVKQPWDAISNLSVRLQLPAFGMSRVDSATQLKEFGRQRNLAAHDSKHQVSSVWIPHAIDLVTKFAVTFDAFSSIASYALRNGRATYLGDDNWTSTHVGIRRVKERTRDWGEYSETGTTAFRVGKDQHAITIGAASRCGDVDLLVVTNVNDEVIDWSIPAVA